MAVGIEAINAYVARACFDVAELFRGRGLDMTRFDNLMMRQKSVNLPCEDAVTNAVNAAKPLLDRLTPAERDAVELLVVGTESGLDLGKPISTYIHHHLGLSSRCRSFEVKHACYGGTAALQTAAGIIGASPVSTAKALVIAADAPSAAARGTYWEPSEGAGAVALLVGRDPRVLELDPGASGLHTFEVMDTLRPRPDLDYVDSDVSLLSYLTCLERSFAAYRERVAGADVVDSFEHLVLHTPFAGMVKGAHRKLLRTHKGLGPRETADDFARRIAPTLHYGSRVGNLFSASLYLALCSLLDRGGPETPCRIGLFSYGSGCGSEFFSGVLGEEAVATVGRMRIGAALDARRELTLEEYDTLTELGGDRAFGVRDLDVDTKPYAELYGALADGAELLVLRRIENFHRLYSWS
ncbi:hydroxymethylglutaryl-CoA synthase family protein [Streptomyces olivaceus]|uniref:hydroxymethylglutaryl-CoA synthase family protein n=1 Tax=Streptomyces olivaceus TaxID=47716 RepID=UPI001CCA99F0|nr:hydroxymethylglutaryl-CoA synthase [Streptomyces olivaceus]MBZ6128908.1 3-hydroxy-3-methylglutaryl-ACP synthase [Streptomyces olivaceus]MBZ6247620.1 3-hydroxy-3-methylglutaryl-ACP synthase [Streptomyces olivaceus]